MHWQNISPHVINLSMNGATETGFGSSGCVDDHQPKLATLAQTRYLPRLDASYPGNVVVQSAGNINQDACSNTVTLPPAD